jgi:hypothetical protein
LSARATRIKVEIEIETSSRRCIGSESKAARRRAVNTNVRRKVQNPLDAAAIPGNTRLAMTTDRSLFCAADLGLISIAVILPL